MLEERIHTLATPAIATRILDEALRRASMAIVPSDGAGLTRFVDGPLVASVERMLGSDAADAIVHDLSHLLRVLCAPVDALDESHIRLTSRPETTALYRRSVREGSPAVTPVAPAAPELVRVSNPHARTNQPAGARPRAPSGRPIPDESQEFEAASYLHAPRIRLVLASASETRARALASALGAECIVTRVDDVFDLIDHASSGGPSAVFVVLDSAHGSVRPTTLAAASTELPAGTTVILWGASETEATELAMIAPEALQWTRLSLDTSAAELAHHLRTVAA